MKVVCIKKYLSTNLKYELTYGKIYETLPKYPNDTLVDDHRVLCDRGFIEYYNKKNFITLEQWREQQLNKILGI